MRPEFMAIQLVGAVVSLAGVACAAALPLPDYRWYNRLAVVLIMGFCTTFVFLAGLWFHDLVDRVGIALGLGIPLVVILVVRLPILRTLYPDVTQARLRAWGVQLMPIGMMVQVVASLLGVMGVPI